MLGWALLFTTKDTLSLLTELGVICRDGGVFCIMKCYSGPILFTIANSREFTDLRTSCSCESYNGALGPRNPSDEGAQSFDPMLISSL
jgi:hypothetical protein